jgi:hypothetical protein
MPLCLGERTGFGLSVYLPYVVMNTAPCYTQG